MRSKFQVAIFAITAALFMSCSSEKKTETVDLAKVKTEIQAMEDAYSAAEKAKDAKAVAAYYASDAISYHRNEDPSSGTAAITAYHTKRMAKDTSGNTNVYKVVDLFGEGNMLVEIGSWSEVDSAGVEVDKGHYMSYFEKREGKYVCVRDMNVSEKPAK